MVQPHFLGTLRSHSLCLLGQLIKGWWAGKADCSMLQLYIKKIEYRVRASIFLSQSAVSPSVPLWARIETLLSNLLQTRLLASHSLSSFFLEKKVVVFNGGGVSLFGSLSFSSYCIGKISSFGESWGSEECSLRREIGVQRPSLRRRGHGPSCAIRQDKCRRICPPQRVKPPLRTTGS